MNCTCPTWRENIDKVNAPNQLLFARNPSTYKGYDGVRFLYCPWCGSLLTPAAPETPDQMHARIVTETADRIAKERGLTVEISAESDGSLQELRQFAHYIDKRLIAVERQLETKAEPTPEDTYTNGTSFSDKTVSDFYRTHGRYALHPHEGSPTVDRGETCLRCGGDMHDPIHTLKTKGDE